MRIGVYRLRGKDRVVFSALTWLSLLWVQVVQAQTLPPADDLPEEVLRTEIILEGRSPLDGEALTATEYTELMAVSYTHLTLPTNREV